MIKFKPNYKIVNCLLSTKNLLKISVPQPTEFSNEPKIFSQINTDESLNFAVSIFSSLIFIKTEFREVLPFM